VPSNRGMVLEMEGVGLRRLLRVELLRLQQISLGRWVPRFDG